jgi:hypothetical protein
MLTVRLITAFFCLAGGFFNYNGWRNFEKQIQYCDEPLFYAVDGFKKFDRISATHRNVNGRPALDGGKIIPTDVKRLLD